MSKHFISSTLNNNLIHCTDETDLNTALAVGNVGKVYELNNTVYEVDTGGSSFVNKPYKDDVGSGAYRFKRYAELPYLCFTANANTNIAFTINGTLTTTPVVQYSVDECKTWNNYTFGNTIALVTGDKCYWKGDNNSWGENATRYIKFTSTGRVSASGNIMSLVDSTCESLVIPCDYCFYRLFNNCVNLITAPKLPATTLTNSCYLGLFGYCSSLLSTPNLPATIIAENCYYEMFWGCTSLTTTPTLPATTLARFCYGGMFSRCTSLTTASNLLATTMADYCCNGMFFECTSLTTAPALSATTLAEGCYEWMFYGCTSLYVSDTSGTGYDKAWRIPTNGTFTNTYSQSGMFTNCLGTRSSNNMAGASGQSYTYYTQNEPV